jgi:hypothetical protein
MIAAIEVRNRALSGSAFGGGVGSIKGGDDDILLLAEPELRSEDLELVVLQLIHPAVQFERPASVSVVEADAVFGLGGL